MILHLLVNCVLLSRKTNQARKSVPSKVVICNSFWGLEEPSPIPPNVVMVGPLIREPTNLMERLEQKDPKLLDWLNDA